MTSRRHWSKAECLQMHLVFCWRSVSNWNRRSAAGACWLLVSYWKLFYLGQSVASYQVMRKSSECKRKTENRKWSRRTERSVCAFCYHSVTTKLTDSHWFFQDIFEFFSIYLFLCRFGSEQQEEPIDVWNWLTNNMKYFSWDFKKINAWWHAFKSSSSLTYYYFGQCWRSQVQTLNDCIQNVNQLHTNWTRNL